MKSSVTGRAQLAAAIRDTMRDVSVQLSLLIHRIGGQVDLKGTDLECLDVIAKRGPIGPGALAKITGLHPATMTGVIDRLERGGWITRERDPNDRRAVAITAVQARGADLLRLFAGMNGQVSGILTDYTDEELTVIAGFLRRIAEAGRVATAELDDQ